MKINEITVNYNHLKNMWVLRKDAVDGKFFKPSGETKSIILQNAEPVIDWDAVDKGQRVFAFVQGDKAAEVPEGYGTRPIKFTRSEEHPFAHVDDNSPFVKADFVTFNEKGAFAHYKDIDENFADGKVKGKSRPGRVKRSGASCNGSVTDLRKRAKNASGEKAKMYHWCANMKSGRKKK